MMVTITIDRALEDPVYQQVADQVRQFVASGDLVVGTSLPSVRGLAGNLGVNLNTVARAYRLLESEGFLEIRDRAGVTVAAPANEAEPATRDKLLDELRSTLARLQQVGMSDDEGIQGVLREFLAMDGSSREDCDE